MLWNEKIRRVMEEELHKRLQDDRRHRPVMSLVVKELVGSLRIQEEYESAKLKSFRVLESDPDEYWDTKLPQDSEDIIKRLIPRASYTNKKELFSLLHEGILFDDKNRFFSINKEGTKCELISAITFIDPDSKPHGLVPQSQSRFGEVARIQNAPSVLFTCEARSAMFTPCSFYSSYLVFKFLNEHSAKSEVRYVLEVDYRLDRKHECIPIMKPKEDDLQSTEGFEMPNSKKRQMMERKDGWMEVNLCKWLYGLGGHNLIEMGFFFL